MDDQKRKNERAAGNTDDHQARARVLVDAMRLGKLQSRQVSLGAFCGDPACFLALDQDVPKPNHLRAIVHHDDEQRMRVYEATRWIEELHSLPHSKVGLYFRRAAVIAVLEAEKLLGGVTEMDEDSEPLAKANTIQARRWADTGTDEALDEWRTAHGRLRGPDPSTCVGPDWQRNGQMRFVELVMRYLEVPNYQREPVLAAMKRAVMVWALGEFAVPQTPEGGSK